MQDAQIADAGDFGPLTRRQVENIADLAAERAEQRFFEALGRSVSKKILYTVGAVACALLAWLNELIHFGHLPK